MALRFDLTVPLARYVAQHYQSLTFPFRRYQIGKVFRGERQQMGRFREFYQCDIDIIGDGELDLLNDAEIPSVIYFTFRELNFGQFVIKINNRKILSGLFDALDIADKSADILRIVDKISKIGQQAVKEELLNLSVKEGKAQKIIEFIKIIGSNTEILSNLKTLNISNEVFVRGAQELEQVLNYTKDFGIPEGIIAIDLSIARGLDYYTGTVYETFLNDYPGVGSVCSGGRFDNLAEFYTDKKLPGVGVSIGLTRLFYQLEEAKIVEGKNATLSKALVAPLVKDLTVPLKVATRLRNAGISTEVYFTDVKVKKKFNYADKLKIPFVIVIGEEEIQKNMITLKDMGTGKQQQISIEEAIKIINN